MPFEGDVQKFIPAPVVETETQKLLRETRERMTPENWLHVGAHDAATGKMCMMYRLWDVAPMPSARRAAAEVCLDDAARELFPERVTSDTRVPGTLCAAAQVNDHPATVFADVLRVFDRAHKMAKPY